MLNVRNSKIVYSQKIQQMVIVNILMSKFFPKLIIVEMKENNYSNLDSYKCATIDEWLFIWVSNSSLELHNENWQ